MPASSALATAFGLPDIHPLSESVENHMPKAPLAGGGCRKSILFVIPGMDAGIQLPRKATTGGGIHPCNLDPGIPCRDDDDTVEKSAESSLSPGGGGWGEGRIRASNVLLKARTCYRPSPSSRPSLPREGVAKVFCLSFRAWMPESSCHGRQPATVEYIPVTWIPAFLAGMTMVLSKSLRRFSLQS